ncbi:hypothetical protein BH10PLA1_BH10PLA1_16750 [soil metagenome]
MSNRKGLASAVAAALLAACGMVHAESASDGLALNRPLMLDDAPAKKPLGQLLDRIGVGKTLDDAGITIGGFVETSWTIADNHPTGGVISGRVFDFENPELTLNQIDLYLERLFDPSKGKVDVGGRVEVIYGGDSRLIHSRDVTNNHGLYYVRSGENRGPDEQLDLNQAYVDIAVPVGNGLKIRAGKFNTLLGYETINPTANALYSHSFMFGFAIPFTNSGVLATYVIDPSLTVTAGLTRGWDVTTTDDNDTIDATGQVAWTINDKSALIFNFIIGPDQPGDNSNYRTVLDVIYTQKLADQLTIAVNADYGYQANANTSGTDAQWYGVAGYATYTVSSYVSTTGRLEFFDDTDGYRGFDSTVYEATLGVTITPMPNDAIGSNLKIRPEVRFDYSGERTFDGDYGQATFGVDAYFTY